MSTKTKPKKKRHFIQYQTEANGGDISSFWHLTKTDKGKTTLCGMKAKKGISRRVEKPETGICTSCHLAEEGADRIVGPFQFGRRLSGTGDRPRTMR